MEPRKFFPNMPDEVFDMWLAPLIEGKGWPFESPKDDLQKSKWRYVLGINRTLQEWCLCEWKLIKIKLSEAKFTGGSMDMIKSIVGNATHGIATETANVENTVERFRACTSFVQKNGNIPLPIIAVINNDVIEVIDGHHRLAALAHVDPSASYQIQAWVPLFLHH